MIMETILKHKTHIIYGVLLVGVLSIGYHMLGNKPKEIIKTLEKIQFVNRDVVKEKIVYLNKTITTHKANGDVIVEVQQGGSNTKLADKSKIESKLTQTETQRFMSNYSIEALFPVVPQSINPLDVQISAGVRLFNFPLFAIIGTDGHLNKIQVGLRLEF